MHINAFDPREWIQRIAMSDWLSNDRADESVMQSTNQIMYGTQNVISHNCDMKQRQPHHALHVHSRPVATVSTARQTTAKQHQQHAQAMERCSVDAADFLQRHKTKAKRPFAEWRRPSFNFLLVIAIALAVVHGGGVRTVQANDVTGLVRIPDDDDDGGMDAGLKHTNQKYSDLGITTDPLVHDDASAANTGRNNPALYNLDKLGSNLEMSIAAVFNKVAYGTTTKRSISDSVSVPSLTTVATPQLTTFRYREKDNNNKETDHKPGTHHQHSQHLSYQKHSNYNNKYPLDLEHDHALPTSAPNADILKSNSNPTYPNPNRHHNHGERHRIHLNSTPSPAAGHNLLNKGQATIPMYPAEIPSYSPPARSFLTPRVPPEYPQNPFAEQPTLRGTNSETGISSNFNINRRPIPPPSLMPGHEKIPLRPPDLVNGASPIGDVVGKTKPSKDPENGAAATSDSDRKKALNTPAQKYGQNRINANITNPSSDMATKIHFPSISRILSGSNGMNGDIPEILLKTVTARPTEIQSEAPVHGSVPERNPSIESASDKMGESDGDFSHGDDSADEDTSSEDEFDSTTFNGEEPKTQPKIKQNGGDGGTTAGQQRGPSTKKVVTETPSHQSDMVYSTQVIQNLAATNTNSSPNGNERKTKQPSVIGGNSKITNERSSVTTWAVAWNIHVYLSAILFTILAVYSIFKMIFYDKLTHLVNQSYFICLHLILIIICLARIFFLCYDAYNIHYSFPLFMSELLLNLPATFLTVSFSILILFLLLRSLNHKNNRYSALMRPLTVFVGSAVHVLLCITLHYVESQGQLQRNQQIQYQQQLLRNSGQLNANQAYMYNTPPRVLSLICQLIYIFICFSLGCFYLYVYRVLKRVLQKKSQNYIHGYQNLSYAIHITIATALLFILLAALQIYGAISISTTRPIMSALSDNDWLQWGYQFSLRLIEIAIIALLSWVTGLKTGTTKVLQRDKVMEQHNVSGFALFPCTSSSSQEHFETDYPAICSANTNLHSYTLRTGKPIYDDTFALSSLGMENGPHGSQMGPPPPHGPGGHAPPHHMVPHHHGHFSPHKTGQDYQVQSMGDVSPHQNESGIYDAQNGTLSKQSNRITPTFNDARSDHLNDSGTIPDHYENPNFELTTNGGNYRKNMQQPYIDNCYTEPIGAEMVYNAKMGECGYDFQNFERPSYAERNMGPGSSATEFRASKNLKALNKANGGHYETAQMKQNNLGAGKHYNPQTHSYNSFDRRGIRKSASSTGGRGNALSTLNLNSASSRTRTLNAPRNSQYDAYHGANNMHRSGAGRASNNSCGNASKAGHRNCADNDFDTISQASSGDGVRVYNADMVFKAQDVNVDAAQHSTSSGDSSTSMLVAEHGFVRFRPMDVKEEKRAKRAAAAAAAAQAAADAQHSMPSSASSNSDNNNLNKNSPAIAQRHHKRSLT